MNLIISIPHSSIIIPKEIHYQFSQPLDNFKKHIDFGVDKICRFSQYNIIEAQFSRFVADLNREKEDIHSDQGVIINKDWNNIPVLKRKLNTDEIERRLLSYDSFYKKMHKLLLSKPNSFLLDCHSMDSKNHEDNSDRPDICLANNFGKTCPKEITKIFKEEFEKGGYKVEENIPYSGSRAKIINFANKFEVPSLELEFNKKTYMDEETLKMNSLAVKKIREILKKTFEKIEAL